MIDGLFLLSLFEMVSGGGGRIYEIGPTTLRIIILFSGLLFWIFGFIRGKRQNGQFLAIFICFIFFVALAPGFIVSQARGISQDLVIKDIEPQLFWLSAPFIAMAFDKNYVAEKSARIMMYGGLAVSSVILAITFFIYVGAIDFFRFYQWGDETGEIFFRSNYLFFAKSHFYSAISLVFVGILRPRWWKIMFAIILLSIILSLTRGIIIAAALTIALSYLDMRKYISVFIFFMIVIVFTSFNADTIIDFFIGDQTRQSSVEIRYIDTQYFLQHLDRRTLLFGEGLGALLNGRSNVENSYMWAIWKMGILGFLFYLSPLIIGFYYFKIGKKNGGVNRSASAFFYGIVMMQVLSISNPFVNNSIGILYSLVAVFALRRISITQSQIPKNAVST